MESFLVGGHGGSTLLFWLCWENTEDLLLTDCTRLVGGENLEPNVEEVVGLEKVKWLLVPVGESTEEDLEVLRSDLRFVGEPKGEDSALNELKVDLKDWDCVGERNDELPAELLWFVLYSGLLFQETGDFCVGDSALSLRGLVGGVVKHSDVSLSLTSVFWRINFFVGGEPHILECFISSEVLSNVFLSGVFDVDFGDETILVVMVAVAVWWRCECLWGGEAWGDIWW